MRSYLAPGTAGIFADSVQQAATVFLVTFAGTTLNEANEDYCAALAQKFMARIKGLPYELNKGKPWKEMDATLKANFSTTSSTAFMPVLRNLCLLYTSPSPRDS